MSYGRKISLIFDKHQDYICHKCQRKAEGLPDLQKKVEDEKKEITDLISRYFTGGRKRTRDESECFSRQFVVDETLSTFDSSTPTRSADSRSTGDKDIPVLVKVGYPSGEKSVDVTSPWGRKNVKRIVRRSYASLSSSVVSSPRTSDLVISSICHTIHKEMKNICSLSHDSILRDSHEGVKHFSWQTVFLELKNNMPTLIKVLAAIITDHKNSKSIICLIACMLLKKRLGKMSLVQRAISILLYGNGCSKQVYKCLQPLMVCLSHAGTIKLVDRISVDYDVEVQFWSDELLSTLKKRLSQPSPVQHQVSYPMEEDETVKHDSDDEMLYEEFEGDESDDGESIADDESEEITEDIDDNQCLQIFEEIMKEDHSQSPEEDYQLTSDKNQIQDVVESHQMAWKGFKIVGDNIDKNFRRTFQRIDYQTRSFHFFHSFAVLDRVDLSGVSDLPKPGIIELTKVLPTQPEIQELKKTLTILVARVLCKHIEEFSGEHSSVIWHIPHEASKDMIKKSKVIPLGILLYNENKLDEMCHIMDALHQYVPAISTDKSLLLPNGDSFNYKKVDMWETLFGGD